MVLELTPPHTLQECHFLYRITFLFPARAATVLLVDELQVLARVVWFAPCA